MSMVSVKDGISGDEIQEYVFPMTFCPHFEFENHWKNPLIKRILFDFPNSCLPRQSPGNLNS